MRFLKSIFFWQPRNDYLRLMTKNTFGKKSLIILNYLIWLFLFYISYLLIKSQTNIFWQILLATIIAEIFERLIKAKVFWKRPLFKRKDPVPDGLVKKWYETGSFPSGHTSKAVFFLLFIIQYQTINPMLFLAVTVPLLFFRVMVGFHYPIDLLGGLVVGLTSWILVHQLVFPPFLVESIRRIFNFVFLIH